MKKHSAPTGKLGFPTGALYRFLEALLPHLRHETPHGLGRLILLLLGGVGVGAEGEPGVVVTQHGGDGLDVHAVLKGQGGEGMPEIMEPEMFQASAFQDALVEGGHRVQVVHGASPGGREEPRVVRVLGVLLHKQFHRLPGNGDLPDRILCLGA